MRYISTLHLIQALNALLYDNNRKLEESDILYLSQLKENIKALEVDTRADLKKAKHKKWLDTDHIEESTQLLNEVYSNVYKRLERLTEDNDAALTARKKLLKTKKDRELYDRLIPIHEDLSNFLKLIKIQQDTQIANLMKSHDSANIYRLLQGLLINYVACRQDADPLFGGYYDLKSTAVLGDGICAGNTIKWIYTCAKYGSPKYPLYAEEEAHYYQEKQQHFKTEESTQIIKVQPIIKVFTELQHQLKPGALYYIGIKGAAGGHALGIRKRHDQVVEFFDTNNGNTFTSDDTRTQLAVLLGLADYILFDDFKTASVWEAKVRDENTTQTYFPDKQTLDKSVAKVVSEQDEMALVAEIKNLLKRTYTRGKYDQATADDYFVKLLPLLIETLTYKESLEQLSKWILLTKSSVLEQTIIPLLQKRVELVKTNEFKSALSNKNKILGDFKKQEEELVKQINDLRSEAYSLGKGKGQQVNNVLLSAVSNRMSKFSQLLTRVKQVRIPALLTAKPLTDAVHFVKETLSKIKGIFSRKNSAAEVETSPDTFLQEIAKEATEITPVNSQELNKRVVLNQKLNALWSLLPSLLIRLKAKHEEELTDSSASNLNLLDCKALYKLKVNSVQQLQKSLTDLQEKVLSDYSQDEASALALFENSLKKLLPLDDTDHTLLASGAESDQEKLIHKIEQILKSRISAADIDQEKLSATASDAHSGLRADQKRMVLSLTTLIDYLSELDRQIHVEVEQFKQTQPGNMSLHHAYYCQQVSIQTHLHALLEARHELTNLHFHTDMAINEHRKRMNQPVQYYKDLFTTDFRLHEDYQNLIRKRLGSLSLLEPEHIETCSILYASITAMVKIVDDLHLPKTNNAYAFWPEASAGETMVDRMIGHHKRALGRMAQQVRNMATDIADPYKFMTAVVEQGYKSFMSAFYKKHHCNYPWSSASGAHVLWQFFCSHLQNCPELIRLAEFSERCESIVNNRGILPMHRGELALFDDAKIKAINDQSTRTFAPYVALFYFLDSAKFKQLIETYAFQFEHWLRQPHYKADTLQGLLLIRMTDWAHIPENTTDITSFLQSQKRHIELLKIALNDAAADESFSIKLNKIEKKYLHPGATPGVAQLLNFITEVNEDFATVYDVHLMGLRDNYREVIQQEILALNNAKTTTLTI